MDFKRRLRRIEDKINIPNNKQEIHISTLTDLIMHAHHKFPEDAEIVIDEKIKTFINRSDWQLITYG